MSRHQIPRWWLNNPCGDDNHGNVRGPFTGLGRGPSLSRNTQQSQEAPLFSRSLIVDCFPFPKTYSSFRAKSPNQEALSHMAWERHGLVFLHCVTGIFCSPFCLLLFAWSLHHSNFSSVIRLPSLLWLNLLQLPHKCEDICGYV